MNTLPYTSSLHHSMDKRRVVPSVEALLSKAVGGLAGTVPGEVPEIICTRHNLSLRVNKQWSNQAKVGSKLLHGNKVQL